MIFLILQTLLFGVQVGIAGRSLAWGCAAAMLGHVIYAAILAANDVKND